MKYLILIIAVLYCPMTFAQKRMGTPAQNFAHYQSSFGVFGGIYQGKGTMGEIGLGIAELDKSSQLFFQGAGLSLEFNPGLGIYGAKLDTWTNLPLLPLSVGISTISYFQEEHFDQTLRPNLGLSFHYFRISYCYDIILGRQQIQELNRHQVFVRYYLPVKKRKRHYNQTMPVE
ncbi:MAG: hypothetical protein ACFHU9_10015 [Fluviicola sp.]